MPSNSNPRLGGLGQAGGFFGIGLSQAGGQQQAQAGQVAQVTHVDQASRTVTINSFPQASQQAMQNAYNRSAQEMMQAYTGIADQAWGRPQSQQGHFEAEEVMAYLNRIDCHVFPEIHLTNDKFIKLQARLNVTAPPDEPIIYRGRYGPVTVRNADHVLNLDRFLEDVPKCKT